MIPTSWREAFGAMVIKLPLFLILILGGANAVAPAGRLHRLYLRAPGGNHVRRRWGRPRLDKVSDQSIHNSLSEVNLVIVRRGDER